MKRFSRGKKKKVLIIIISSLVIVAGIVAAFIIGLGQIEAKYRLEVATLESEMEANKRTVYLANSNGIPAGTKIDIANTHQATIYSSEPYEYYMSENDLGRIATVDILADQAINTSMVGDELEFGLRENQFSLVKLSSNLSVDDFIDVRIMYPNGENYIVLSKKHVKQLDLNINDVFLWLDEEEIMLMSSAIVDTYLHEGAILYTTKYIEDTQETTQPTYVPTTDCMVAMTNDVNILEEATTTLNASMRMSLDKRLSDYEANNDVNLNNSLNSYQGDNSGNSNIDGESGVLSGVDTGEGTGEELEDPNEEPEDSLVYDYEEDGGYGN